MRIVHFRVALLHVGIADASQARGCTPPAESDVPVFPVYFVISGAVQMTRHVLVGVIDFASGRASQN
jgi:hypothetical protein